MVWRLRFYDNGGVEIGYAEKPDKSTYNVVITHPDSGWDDFREKLELYERHVPDKDEGNLQSPEWIAESGPMIDEWPPEAHLQKVQDEFSYPDVADSVLNDE
ncbi:MULTISPECIES: hypothetical protein [Halorubrum]|uniref:hypothetical protein n=1 Tax=Halorubrum TaxID=56688 RepID=UPI001266F266|nr:MULTISPECIES: hypothetical protein [Halorubrum]